MAKHSRVPEREYFARKVEGISQKMLSKTARNLERDGLLTRRLIDETPLHVEYELTDRGRELLVIIRALKKMV